MSTQEGVRETVYESRYIEKYTTSRSGKGSNVTTKRCVVCEKDVRTEGISRHLSMNESCRETLLGRLDE